MNKNWYVLKPYKDKLLHGLAVWLVEHGIGADVVTIAGLLCGLGAAGCLLGHHNLPAMALLALSVGADLLDGTVARLGDGGSWRGKVLDAVCDRLVEFAWIGVLVVSGRLSVWAWSLIVGSVLLLVCRIGAYYWRLDSSFVRVTRFERVALMYLVVILPWSALTMGIYATITVGTVFSSVQIIHRIWKRKSPGCRGVG